MRNELRSVAEKVVVDESDYDGPGLLVPEGGDDAGDGRSSVRCCAVM